MSQKKITVILFILIIIFSTFSLFIGAINITQNTNNTIKSIDLLFISRLPRLLAILCTGSGMSVAGLVMQKLCMNKFISPTTGTTIASSQIGVLLSLLVFPHVSIITKTFISFFTALVGTSIFIWFIQKIKLKNIIMLPLIGIMFGNIISAIINYYAYKYDVLQVLTASLTADFSLILKGNYEIVFLVFPLIIVAYIYANHFNIVGMGEAFSKNIGLSYEIMLFLGFGIASLITASVVVTVGTISYIGLIVPNIFLMFKGDKIQNSLVDIMLCGALFVLVCDIISRLVIYPYELPINLITGIIGSIIFVILMYQRLKIT